MRISLCQKSVEACLNKETISVAEKYNTVICATCFSSSTFKPDLHNPFLQSLSAEELLLCLSIFYWYGENKGACCLLMHVHTKWSNGYSILPGVSLFAYHLWLQPSYCTFALSCCLPLTPAVHGQPLPRQQDLLTCATCISEASHRRSAHRSIRLGSDQAKVSPQVAFLHSLAEDDIQGGSTGPPAAEGARHRHQQARGEVLRPGLWVSAERVFEERELVWGQLLSSWEQITGIWGTGTPLSQDQRGGLEKAKGKNPLRKYPHSNHSFCLKDTKRLRENMWRKQCVSCLTGIKCLFVMFDILLRMVLFAGAVPWPKVHWRGSNKDRYLPRGSG